MPNAPAADSLSMSRRDRIGWDDFVMIRLLDFGERGALAPCCATEG
jgi:hypothetical protein